MSGAVSLSCSPLAAVIAAPPGILSNQVTPPGCTLVAPLQSTRIVSLTNMFCRVQDLPSVLLHFSAFPVFPTLLFQLTFLCQCFVSIDLSCMPPVSAAEVDQYAHVLQCVKSELEVFPGDDDLPDVLVAHVHVGDQSSLHEVEEVQQVEVLPGAADLPDVPVCHVQAGDQSSLHDVEEVQQVEVLSVDENLPDGPVG